MRTLLEGDHKDLKPKGKRRKAYRYDVKLGNCQPYVEYKVTRITGRRGIKKPAKKVGLEIGTEFRVMSNNPPKIKVLKDSKIVHLTDNNLGAGMSSKFRLNVYCRRVSRHERKMYQ